MDCTENRAKYCHLSDEEKKMFPIERKKDGMYCILKDNGETDFCSHDTGFNPRSIYRLNLIDGEWYAVVKTSNRKFIFKYKSGLAKTSASVIYNIDGNSFFDQSYVCSDVVIEELRPALHEEVQKVEALLNPAPTLPDWVVFESGCRGLELRFNNSNSCLSIEEAPYSVSYVSDGDVINNSTLTLTKTDEIKDGSWYWEDTVKEVFLKVEKGFVNPSQANCSITYYDEWYIDKSNLWEITHNG